MSPSGETGLEYSLDYIRKDSLRVPFKPLDLSYQSCRSGRRGLHTQRSHCSPLGTSQGGSCLLSPEGGCAVD